MSQVPFTAAAVVVSHHAHRVPGHHLNGAEILTGILVLALIAWWVVAAVCAVRSPSTWSTEL